MPHMPFSRRQRQLIKAIQKHDMKSATSVVEGNFIRPQMNIFQSFDASQESEFSQLLTEDLSDAMDSILYTASSQTEFEEKDHEIRSQFELKPQSFLDLAIFYKNTDFIAYFIQRSQIYDRESAHQNTNQALHFLTRTMSQSTAQNDYFKTVFDLLKPTLTKHITGLLTPELTQNAESHLKPLISQIVKHSDTDFYDGIISFVKSTDDQNDRGLSDKNLSHELHQTALQEVIVSSNRSFLNHLIYRHLPSLKDFAIRWDLVFKQKDPVDQLAWTLDLLKADAPLSSKTLSPYDCLPDFNAERGPQEAWVSFFSAIDRDGLMIKSESSMTESFVDGAVDLNLQGTPDIHISSLYSHLFHALIKSPDFDVSYHSRHQGMTPLMLAAKTQKLHANACDFATHCAKTFLDLGADLEAKDVYHHTALYFAIESRNSDLTQLLIERGSPFDYASEHSQNVKTILYSSPEACTWIEPILTRVLEGSASRDVKERVSELLQGLPFSLKHSISSEPSDQIALEAPAANSHRLPQEGAQDQAPSSFKAKPLKDLPVPHLDAKKTKASLHRPASNFSPLTPILEIMMDLKRQANGAHQDQFDSTYGSSFKESLPHTEKAIKCLHATYAQQIAALLQVKVDPNLLNHQSQSALHLAAQTGDLQTVQLLVGSGADLNARDHHGKTPLMHAAESYHIQQGTSVLEYLLSEGADPLPKTYLPPFSSYQDILDTSIEILPLSSDSVPFISPIQSDSSEVDTASLVGPGSQSAADSSLSKNSTPPHLDLFSKFSPADLLGFESDQAQEQMMSDLEARILNDYARIHGKQMSQDDQQRLFKAQEQGAEKNKLKGQAFSMTGLEPTDAIRSFIKQSTELEHKILSPSVEKSSEELIAPQSEALKNSRRRLEG